jgi:hypothetical protein
MVSSKQIESRIAELRSRLEAADAALRSSEADISAAVLEDRALNGALRKRDESAARRGALERRIRELSEEELPAARQREAAAERERRLAEARAFHARELLRLAREFDRAAGAAARSLADLRAAQSAFAGMMAAAGEAPRRVDWSHMVRLALWGAKARDSWWRGSPDVVRPGLAQALGLSPALRTHARAMADQVAALAPPEESDPLEIRPQPARAVVPPPPTAAPTAEWVTKG